MTLAAAQVVDAVAARVAALPAYAGRVHTSRLWPLTEAELPAWRITAADEPVGPGGIDGFNEHALLIEARGYARATADLDDALHALAHDAQAAIFMHPVPHGVQLERIDRDTATEGEVAVGVLTLSLRATYHVAPDQPDLILTV
jgi:hypothetical protein